MRQQMMNRHSFPACRRLLVILTDWLLHIQFPASAIVSSCSLLGALGLFQLARYPSSGPFKRSYHFAVSIFSIANSLRKSHHEFSKFLFILFQPLSVRFRPTLEKG